MGYDYHEASIAAARQRAGEAGMSDRVRFEVATADEYPGRYDLVALFDSLHDMGDPMAAAQHVRESLQPDCTWMLVSPAPATGSRTTSIPLGGCTTRCPR